MRKTLSLCPVGDNLCLQAGCGEKGRERQGTHKTVNNTSYSWTASLNDHIFSSSGGT